MAIFFKKSIINTIIRHCKINSPRESCGILSGKRQIVNEIYRMKNISDNPESCYQISPREQLRVFKAIRAKRKKLIGIYHSHYKLEAFPSPRDISLAFYPDVFYVIISLKNLHQEIGKGVEFEGKNVVIRAFRIRNGKVIETKILIENEK